MGIMKQIGTIVAFTAFVVVMVLTVCSWFIAQDQRQTKELRSAATVRVVVEQYDTVYDIMNRVVGDRREDFFRDVLYDEFSRLNGGKKAISSADIGRTVRVPDFNKNVAAAQ